METFTKRNRYRVKVFCETRVEFFEIGLDIVYLIDYLAVGKSIVLIGTSVFYMHVDLPRHARPVHRVSSVLCTYVLTRCH